MLTAHTQPRMRVDGRLGPIEGQPVLTPDDMRAGTSRDLLTAELHAELYEKKEVDFSFSYRDTHRFRGNCFIQQGIVALSLRSIPLAIPSFETLLLPWGCEHFCNLPQGLVLVTGPTGSGKSTTLASMIDYINSRRAVPHPLDRGPDRVRAHAQGRRREPARGRVRHRLVPPRACAPRSVRTPTSSSSVRCVTRRRSSSR